MKLKIAFFTILVFLLSNSLAAQTRDSKWVMSLGGGYIKFPTTLHAGELGSNIQVPNIGLSRYIDKGMTVDLGVTAPIFKFGENQINYMAFDISLRYDFNQSEKILVPYVMTGFNLFVIDAVEKPVGVSLGGGATYWLSEFIGIKAQVLYKYVPVKYKAVLPSHVQYSLGVVIPFEARALKRGSGMASSRGGFCD